MHPRHETTQVGLSWVVRTMGWVGLVGSVLVAAPVAAFAGKEAGLWALSAIGAVALTYGWLGLEALRAWRGPERSHGVDSVPLPSRS